MTRFGFMIGTSSSGMINVESLPIPCLVGMWEYKSAQEFSLRADMSTQMFGPASVTWTQAIVSATQRNQWRIFCPSASANVYIKTRVNDDSNYHTFPATMTWPETESHQAGRVLNLVLNFFLGEEIA
jgi:hypothetical protein